MALSPLPFATTWDALENCVVGTATEFILTVHPDLNPLPFTFRRKGALAAFAEVMTTE